MTPKEAAKYIKDSAIGDPDCDNLSDLHQASKVLCECDDQMFQDEARATLQKITIVQLRAMHEEAKELALNLLAIIEELSCD